MTAWIIDRYIRCHVAIQTMNKKHTNHLSCLFEPFLVPFFLPIFLRLHLSLNLCLILTSNLVVIAILGEKAIYLFYQRSRASRAVTWLLVLAYMYQVCIFCLNILDFLFFLQT